MQITSIPLQSPLVGSGAHTGYYPLGDLQLFTNLNLVPAPMRCHIVQFQKLQFFDKNKQNAPLLTF